MMRSLLLAFALSTSLVALSTVPAYAQTDQTDQSEEDWRKSRKKRDTSDIFEDIKNSGIFGSGTMQGPPNPVESLPEDSRRHLMKERARVIATTETGQAPDTTYKPSEDAKNDPNLEEQEKEAWEVIMTDLKGTGGQGQPGDGPNKVAVAGQGGSGSPSNSTMRGGSSQSVADILAQIKGLKSGSLGGGSGSQGSGGGSGQSPLGTGGGGQQGQQAGTQGQSQQGQQAGSQTNGTGQQAGSQKAGGQSQGQAQQGQGQSAQGQQDQSGQQGQAQQASAQNAGQSQSQSDQNSQSASDSNSDASAQNNSADNSDSADAAKAAEQAAMQAAAEAQAHAQHESIGPLDRIKQERSSSGVGSNTSASDFLKKKTSD